MTKFEKIKIADEIIKSFINRTLNFNSADRGKREVIKKELPPNAENVANEDLMKFSQFTIQQASERLNKFDYYMDNIAGTEIEVASVTSGNAYIVDFRPSTKQASCTCSDFIYRARICKHIAFVHDSFVSIP